MHRTRNSVRAVSASNDLFRTVLFCLMISAGPSVTSRSVSCSATQFGSKMVARRSAFVRNAVRCVGEALWREPWLSRQSVHRQGMRIAQARTPPPHAGQAGGGLVQKVEQKPPVVLSFRSGSVPPCSDLIV
jgi:hypothetical protein